MKRVLLSLTVGSIALTTVLQERAIAFYNKTLSAEGLESLKDEYRRNLKAGKVSIENNSSKGESKWRKAFVDSWKKAGHEGANWLGTWNSDRGTALVQIYPSTQKTTRVCIVTIAMEGESEFRLGHVNRGAVYLDDGSLLFPEKGKLIQTMYPGPRFYQLTPSSQALSKSFDRPSFPPGMRKLRQVIDRQISDEGCTTSMPE